MANTVVKTNWLNQALQTLTLLEIRIIQLAIIDARESGLGLSPDKPLTISAKRYAEVFGVQAKNAYAKIKEAEDTLFKRQFTCIDPKDGKTIKSRWVQDVKYLDQEGKIELCFSRVVVQGISRIDGAVDFFTKYLLSNTINFRSVYSVRLYELLTQWKSADPQKMPMFELGKLRAQLGLEPTEYERFDNFKSRVLEKAIKEINEHSDLTVRYEQVKKGRLVVGFYFYIEEKNKKDANKKIKLTEKQRLFFADKLASMPELGALADPGQSQKEFAAVLAERLKNQEQIEQFRPQLLELGLKI